MACAARLAMTERSEACARVAALADTLVAGVLGTVTGSGTAVPADRRIAAIVNLWFDGVEAEELLLVLDKLGICASAGSACASGAIEPSHVLLAMAGRRRRQSATSDCPSDIRRRPRTSTRPWSPFPRRSPGSATGVESGGAHVPGWRHGASEVDSSRSEAPEVQVGLRGCRGETRCWMPARPAA